MPLILQPEYSNLARQEIEAHLEAVRSRRLLGAMEYHEGKKIKLEKEAEKIQRKVKQQYEMLGKELNRLEALDEKIQERLIVIESLHQEYCLTKELADGA